jgi:hypothetical protein
MMNRINFGKLSGTVVDVCKGHGTFLDSGELHQVVAFIRDGGLDRARRRQLEDLKEEEGRLRGLQQTAIRESSSTDMSGWDLVDGSDVLGLLGHLFDTLGRRAMIAFTYGVSGVLLALNTLADVVVVMMAATARASLTRHPNLLQQLRQGSGLFIAGLGISLALARRPAG